MAARKAVDQELTREKILETARDLFVSKGYQHVTMRHIAQLLGYSHGSLYYHFKNKAELFYSLVEKDFGILNETLDTFIKEDTDVETKLKRILLGYIEFGIKHPNHYRIMFLLQDDDLQTELQQEPNVTYEKFASALHTLCGSKVTPMIIWSLFLSLHGFVVHYCGQPEQTYDDVKGMAASHVRFLMKGLL
ncbi:TetR/AcrR family transcriptional regulator [Halalkalibacter hemicellulosilyticus]|uniref:Transcriptional regulator n=1 Tax=Halalkalibacter hemicellulosilyticusJCM 9152 TaxID=1236971 RepID=W4QIM2_9BACI|nr:TetR/AcrR family transcriptional regulator [Halalkalibacter hemicellulosilyticus]GAE31960.1 transcriptional regulator [Halalkalibacter hemicellulosilyticusJCM 9152]